MIQQIIEYFETFEIDNTEQNKIEKQQDRYGRVSRLL